MMNKISQHYHKKKWNGEIKIGEIVSYITLDGILFKVGPPSASLPRPKAASATAGSGY